MKDKNVFLILIIAGFSCLVYGFFATSNNYLFTMGNFAISGSFFYILLSVFFLSPAIIILSGSVRNYAAEIIKFWWPLLIIVACVLAVGVAIGFYIGNGYIALSATPPSQEYKIFHDILIMTLTILSVFIAITAGLIYTLFKNRIERIASSAVDERGNFISANLLNAISFSFYLHYRSTKEPKNLDRAVGFSEMAFRRFSGIKNKETKECTELECHIKNNWGYYLAERGNLQDKDLALNCAGKLKNHTCDFPDKNKIWQDTVEFIEDKYQV